MSRGSLFGPAMALPFVLALAVYFAQALHSPLLDGDLAGRTRYLDALTRPVPGNPAIEAAAAESYWQRYPDVAVDVYYGRRGLLGARGARQHFLDHGRREGRQWEP